MLSLPHKVCLHVTVDERDGFDLIWLGISDFHIMMPLAASLLCHEKHSVYLIVYREMFVHFSRQHQNYHLTIHLVSCTFNDPTVLIHHTVIQIFSHSLFKAMELKSQPSLILMSICSCVLSGVYQNP